MFGTQIVFGQDLSMHTKNDTLLPCYLYPDLKSLHLGFRNLRLCLKKKIITGILIEEQLNIWQMYAFGHVFSMHLRMCDLDLDLRFCF